MTILVHQKGDFRRISGAFVNAAGAAADPTVVKFLYTKPSGVTVELVYGTDAALVKDSTGNYHVDLDITEAGQWLYRYEGTGTVQSAENGEFMVEPSAFVVEAA